MIGWLLPALLSSAHAVELPRVSVSWRKGVATLWVIPPDGQHIAPEAPATFEVQIDGQRWSVDVAGGALVDGLTLPAPYGHHTIQGTVALGICEDGGDVCALVNVGFIGQIDGRRGKDAPFGVFEPGSHRAKDEDKKLDADAAFERARVEEKLVLIDFGAVWCPPCNLLAADILHDPANAADLSPFVLLEVDVDRPESWPLKDQYAVGGYPTLVVARASGGEVDRMEGYPGEDIVVDWLAGVSDAIPLSALPSPDSVDPTTAGRLALRLARLGRSDDAAAYLTRAMPPAAPDSTETIELDDPTLREARFHIAPTRDDALWLANDGEGDDILQWAMAAWEIAEDDTDVADALVAAISRRLPSAPSIEAADLYWLSAQLADERAAKALNAAAARTLSTQLTGNAESDRGHWTFLAELYREAGDPDAATSQLLDAISAYPEEFTFHYAMAGHRLKIDQPASAIHPAEQALAYGYGDNRLRAAERLARARAANGDVDGAVALIDEVLASAERPADDLQVRTPRYIAALERARDEISPPPADAPGADVDPPPPTE